MDITNKYVSTINEATKIAESYISNETSKNNLKAKASELLNNLHDDAFIKVPLVGDFNAGKSSLINSYIGMPDYLPTDIVPQTAVSYELYYSQKEHLEVWNDGNKIGDYPLSQIKSLDTKPSYIVRVFLNNDKVKALNDKNIVLVDMPGIDSGLEAHSNAILNYIQQGTHFIVLTDVEQGTLRSTTIQFLKEIKEYQKDNDGVGGVSILLSKTDKKPENEIEEVKRNISEAAVRHLGQDIFVGATSAVSNEYADLDKVLDSLDAPKLITEKFKPQVDLLVNGIISELELQIKLILSNKEDFKKKIEQVSKEKENAIALLNEKNAGAQSVEGSADDIVNDVIAALNASSTSLASALFSGQKPEEVNATIASIIRPVLLNSFKRELAEYQESIGSAVSEFSLKVNEIINDKDNKILNGAEELVGQFLGKEVLENFLKKGLDKLALRLAGYKGLGTLFSTLSKLIGPVVIIVINIIPDLLRLIFGKSREAKIAEIRQKLSDEVFGKIAESLRPEIEKMLTEQRAEAQQSVVNIITEEAAKYDANIKDLQDKQQLSQQETEQKVSVLSNAMLTLKNLIA